MLFLNIYLQLDWIRITVFSLVIHLDSIYIIAHERTHSRLFSTENY